MSETGDLIPSIVPLYIIHLAGGVLKGRTRLQKLVFLAQKRTNDQIDYEFTKGWYGPVSYKLMEMVRNMASLGLVEERIGRTGVGFKVAEYRLTKQGKELVDYALSRRIIRNRLKSKVDDAFEEYGRLPFIKLLDRVHKEYPQWVEKGLMISSS